MLCSESLPGKLTLNVAGSACRLMVCAVVATKLKPNEADGLVEHEPDLIPFTFKTVGPELFELREKITELGDGGVGIGTGELTMPTVPREAEIPTLQPTPVAQLTVNFAVVAFKQTLLAEPSAFVKEGVSLKSSLEIVK